MATGQYGMSALQRSSTRALLTKSAVVDGSIWFYKPILAAAIVFAIAFGLLTISHSWQVLYVHHLLRNA